MLHFNIEISQTTNQNIVKFIANSFLTPSTSYEFKNIDEAKASPLAQQLFYLPFVKTVYISQNFIAIEKYDILEWKDVQEEVADSIAEYLNSGKSVITEMDTPKKLPITIYAESTPNPTVMKFIANKTLATGIFEFKNSDEATNSPLAKALFNFPFVKEVFISSNYISVMKHDWVEWQDLTMEIREFIRKFIEDGKSVLNEEASAKTTPSESISSTENTLDQNQKPHTELEKEIISILDEYVKPAVARDGGHILFDSFNETTKTVKVILQGACSGCPSSTITLKNGIETMLKEMLNGQIDSVEAVNG
ncbi:thioredoxin-like protein [Aequorivita sublithincola DSM 14238]|uniref:Thioredoxin-like protein n=1 Tax=Aequorivita sublithincola (strain DSM 14238 / LMG 21431 / ACAM 643 / 9-3) TaxID=746697 RepID=I3YTN8_AEQSU|nr:NifU family protein [Aequorivita sublithincola]AFL80356.1 thioredoxin-like protein [Aequorivita sublithincola DSM 14238]